MGFSEAQAKKALNKTGWSGIEAAAEWLLSNPDDDGTEDTPAESTTAAAVSIFTPYNLYSWYLYFIIIKINRRFIKHKTVYSNFVTSG